MVVAAVRSTNAAEATTVDIFDAIGADMFGEGVTARSVNRALLEAGDGEIVVRLHSPGGDVFEGHAIYNLLRARGEKLRVEIVGLAASMGSVIAQAGHRVSMRANAMMMIHNPWIVAVGDEHDLRRGADMLAKVRDMLLPIYEANSNASREQLVAMLDAETWLTADEALELGFVDEVLPVVDEPAPEQSAAARMQHVLARFERTPAAVCARYGGRDPAVPKPKRKEKIVNTTEIAKLLGLAEDASEDQIKAALQCKQSPAAAPPVDVNAFVPRADYDALRASLAAREQAEKEQQRRTFEARVEASVAEAVKAGKIPPVSADYHRSTCLAGGAAALEAFAAYVDRAPEIAGTSQMQRAEQRDAETGATAGDRKILARLGVTPDELAKTRAEMREKPEIYPEEAYPFA